jgi:hypothetical protein
MMATDAPPDPPGGPPVPAPSTPAYDPYPGGAGSPGYRLAFQAWIALFLLTICAGLVHFLLTWVSGLGR